MGKRKKRKSNVGTIIMIIVIVLLSLFVYLLATKRIDFNNKNDDLVEDNTNIDNNKNNNDKNDKTISKEEAITISKEKMPVMISLANQKRGLYGYCGEFDEDADFLTIGNDTYDLSSEFKSVSEVKKYLEENISSELINEYFDNNKYQEKDGKLYCMVAHKGVDLAYLRNENMINNDNTKYDVLNLGNDSFDVEVVISYYSVGDNTPSNLLTISSKIEKIDGKYAMLSRPSDNGHTPFGDIYISYSPDMKYWGEHRCVMKVTPFPESAWQCTKIGAGSVPFLTEEGWLIFYHGVITTCNGFRYSMGAAILDKENPAKVLYRTRPYLLAPAAPYELQGDVPNVVFPCASLQDGDKVAVYYGAADTVVGMAFGYISEIIEFTKKNSIV